MTGTATKGKVLLVGAGPGSVDLLTLRAARAIENADVVLYDALIGTDILQLARPSARLINVGKRCGKKSLSQEDINALLVYWARSGDAVVRLKGGDPGIFGRGGEEAAALREAKIEFEIIPGVTAACSAAAAAGISLTDRNAASQVVFATVHHSDENSGQSFAAAAREGRTLVLYMPGHDYERIFSELRGAGLAADTPCVVVSKVGSAEQEVTWSDVRSLASHAALPSPSVLIIGEVARRPAAEVGITFRVLDAQVCHAERGRTPESKHPEGAVLAGTGERHSIEDATTDVVALASQGWFDSGVRPRSP